MARPYSQDLRERMVWAVLSGQSRHEVVRMFDVSASCVIKLMQRVDATGDCQPRKFGGWPSMRTRYGRLLRKNPI